MESELAVELHSAYIQALSEGKSVNQVWEAMANFVTDMLVTKS